MYNYRKFGSRRKIIRLVSLVSVVFVAVIGFMIFASSINSAHISSTIAPAAKLATSKFYNGKFVSFEYNGEYSVQPRKTSPQVEQVMLTADTSYEKLIAVSVQPMISGGIQTDTGYYYRESHPYLYQKKTVTVDGSAATEWIRDDGTERTIYIPHNNMYAVLAFSLAQTNDTTGLASEVSALLQTFQWK